MKKIRTLKANEIEVRAADKNKNGNVHMLLYINSRSATNILDETYGMENYNIEYQDVAGQIYCKLSIWDEDNQRYICRMDTGEEAKISADKSLASDALKRTIVRLGVTELYSTPSIYIADDGYGNSGYSVSEIEYDGNRNITHLVLVNRFNKEVFRWDKPQTQATVNYQSMKFTASEQKPINTTTTSQIPNLEILKNFYEENKSTANEDELIKFCRFYKKKINDGWKNEFRPLPLWERWINNNFS